MSDKREVLTALIDQGLLPLFYRDSIEESISISRALYQAGIRVFEYTNRGSAALENFKYLLDVRDREMADLRLGIGTVRTLSDANAFINAGADFIVAPVVTPSVAEACNNTGLLWIPGCMTPTEIQLAQDNNALLIKIFPANILGPAFVSSIKELFPGQLFMPTGGVEINMDNLTGWFNSGVCAVGMGSKLISKEIIENKHYDHLTELTVQVLQLIKSCKSH